MFSPHIALYSTGTGKYNIAKEKQSDAVEYVLAQQRVPIDRYASTQHATPRGPRDHVILGRGSRGVHPLIIIV